MAIAVMHLFFRRRGSDIVYLWSRENRLLLSVPSFQPQTFGSHFRNMELEEMALSSWISHKL